MTPFLMAAMMLAETGAAIGSPHAASTNAINGAAAAGAVTNAAKYFTVKSQTADFDRKEGLIMFEGSVVVFYSDQNCTMWADKLYIFTSGTNELSRVVAIDNVSISNNTWFGTCPMAVYRHRRSEVEMFGNSNGRLARLVDCSDKGQLEGTRIRFWLDSEQAEVESARIDVKTKEGTKLL